MIRDRVKTILQECINKEYGIEEPKEVTLESVMKVLESLSL